jgi:4-aminobutyrate aminotransferase-like enzyme
VLDAAKERGLIVGKGGLYANVLRICPPLIVTNADVDAAIAILDRAFAVAADAA